MAGEARGVFDLSFQEQIRFFRNKLNLPTEAWDDIWQAAHDRAFVVAGAMKADLLQDLREAVTKAIEKGTTLETFRRDFRSIVAKHGWTGWTGEGSKGGEAWRTRVIYETNLRTSYAAGRWAQLTDPDVLKNRPYWRYVHNDSVLHPRPLHKRWGDMRLTLRFDDPFWQTHFPPNGWGCRCRVTAVTGPQDGDATAPPAGWNARDSAGVLPGIDRGWAYAPGAATDTSLRQMVQDKLITYPPAITKALSRDVTRYINAHEPAVAYARRVLEDRSKIEPLWLGFVESVEEVSQAAGQDVSGYLVLLPDEAPRHAQRSHGHDGGGQRAPTPADYAQIWKLLAAGSSHRPGDVSDKGLATVVATAAIGDEVFRGVFEVRPGKHNRALALISLVIKR